MVVRKFLLLIFSVGILLPRFLEPITLEEVSVAESTKLNIDNSLESLKLTRGQYENYIYDFNQDNKYVDDIYDNLTEPEKDHFASDEKKIVDYINYKIINDGNPSGKGPLDIITDLEYQVKKINTNLKELKKNEISAEEFNKSAEEFNRPYEGLRRVYKFLEEGEDDDGTGDDGMSTGRISDDLPRLSKKSLREPGVLDKLRYKLKNFKDKLKDGLKKFGEKISNWGSGDAKPTDGDGLAGQESSDGLGEQEDSPESGGLADRTAELGKVEAILEKDIKEGENLGDSGELNKAITEFAGQKNVEIENPEGKVTGYSDMDDGSRVTVQSSTLPEGWSDPATITEPEPIETGEEGFGEGGGLGGMEGGSFG